MNDSTDFLRRSLQLDGIASGLTGALLLVGATRPRCCGTPVAPA
jgi:hypothetical protein